MTFSITILSIMTFGETTLGSSTLGKITLHMMLRIKGLFVTLSINDTASML